MAALLKKLHSTTFEPGTLPDARNGLHAWADVAERSGRYLPETITKLRALIDSIPPQNTFIHGDFHPANIMVSGEEWLLIDMGDASVGHPVIDLLASFHLMKLVGSRGDNALRFVGIPGDLLGKVWDIFIRTYLETENAQLVEDVENTLNYYAQIRSLNGVAFVPAYSDAQRPRVAKAMEGAFLQSYEQWGDSLLKKLPL
jgi:aminoglycoside phosphotransferase (APT) family kinase protein